MIPKPGHDRFMSERTSANAAQLVIDQSRMTRFTPLWKPGSPPPQAGNHRVTSRTTGIPNSQTLPGMIPKPADDRFMTERPSVTTAPSVIETAWSVKGTHALGTKLGMKMRMSGRSVDTGDSGIGTVRTHGTRLAMESWVPDTLLVKGDVGVDNSTPWTGVNDCPQPRHLGQYCSPIPELPTLPSPTQEYTPGTFFR